MPAEVAGNYWHGICHADIGTRVDWRTFAAVWGAGLSTLLALSRIEWPLVSFEPGRPPTNLDSRVWVRVRIINSSKRSLVVVGISQFQRWRRSERIKLFREPDVGSNNTEAATIQEIKFSQHSYDNTLPLYVSGEKSVVVRIAEITGDASHFLVFWWHRNGLLGFRLPLFVRVSAHLARQINGA
jgi:hypothetical protein